MAARLELQRELEDILGSRRVYFNPPDNVRLEYPCIVYRYEGDFTRHADDDLYIRVKRYMITVISKDSESTIAENILNRMKRCRYSRNFRNDNLYHDILTLYY